MEPTQASAPMRTTVLLVDDEEWLRRLLSRMLLEAGFTVVDAENGRQAQEFRPIRPSVPILFFTGRDLPERAASGHAWDEDVLRKPFAAEVFLDAVTRLVTSSSASPAP
jgi:CheY-like chemotaxis protein